MTFHSMSLPAILTGVARTLREDVLPELADDYAKMQVRAIAELMTNLAPRAPGDPALVAETAARSERAAGAEPTGDTPEERLRAAREAVGALVDSLYTGGSMPDVRALVEAEFAAEEDLVTTGSLKN